jgi:hypothetical protein
MAKLSHCWYVMDAETSMQGRAVADSAMRSHCGRNASGDEFAGEGVADHGGGGAGAVEGGERAEARALFLAEQHLVERLEPIAQWLEGVLLADLVDDVLDQRAFSGAGAKPRPLAGLNSSSMPDVNGLCSGST